VATPNVAGVESFSHAIHLDLPCGRCHGVEVRHGSLEIASFEECQACHHGPPPVAACERCHPAAETGATFARTVSLALVPARPTRMRSLPFDHGIHQQFGCESCHAPGALEQPVVQCSDCHEAHHSGEIPCLRCHAEPPPGAHSLEVHDGGCGGASCHPRGTFPEMQLTRDFCLSCHQGQVDHMAGRNCAGCHKLRP
jgi:hypothetical protein